MKTPDYVTVEIPGHPQQFVPTNNLPPIGTRFTVHKHLTDGGTYMQLEVVSHEWTLEEPNEEDGTAYFAVTIHTKRVK